MQHRLQPPGKNIGVGYPPTGVFLQQFAEDVLQFGGCVGRIFPHRLRLFKAMFVQHLGERFAAEHRSMGKQGVHQCAQAIKIRAGIDGLPLGLFRGHVFSRTKHVARDGQPSVAEEPRNAEVG